MFCLPRDDFFRAAASASGGASPNSSAKETEGNRFALERAGGPSLLGEPGAIAEPPASGGGGLTGGQCRSASPVAESGLSGAADRVGRAIGGGPEAEAEGGRDASSWASGAAAVTVARDNAARDGKDGVGGAGGAGGAAGAGGKGGAAGAAGAGASRAADLKDKAEAKTNGLNGESSSGSRGSEASTGTADEGTEAAGASSGEGSRALDRLSCS